MGIDDPIGSGLPAAQVTYDNNGSGLSAVQVQSAIDEVVTLSSTPKFLAVDTTGAINVTGNGEQPVVGFNSEIYDDGGNFASNTFTAPITAKYTFNFGVNLATIGAAHTSGFLILNTSNRDFVFDIQSPGATRDATNNLTLQGSTDCDMDAGDTAVVEVNVQNGTTTINIIGVLATIPTTWFSGRLAA